HQGYLNIPEKLSLDPAGSVADHRRFPVRSTEAGRMSPKSLKGCVLRTCETSRSVTKKVARAGRSLILKVVSPDPRVIHEATAQTLVLAAARLAGVFPGHLARR